ncbi:unnamed protein product, partial [Mesorhabditis belari]|uniref:RecQ-mediated genome instability protein 1 n=1 Tax=Mesorhabditis belari TaxID=2138241 RepID=A0AAF3EW90_9BILA
MSSLHREAVFNFFVEKGILLKDEWLLACLEFLYGRSVLRNQQPIRVNALVFEQWLNTDLADSSYPTIGQIELDLNAERLELPSQLILQIASLTDIGMSAHGQLNGFTHDVVDDSGFEPLQEKDQESYMKETSKRCLLFEANDGANHVKLLEYYPTPFLSLKVRPGAKILMLPQTRIRRGTFYLTAKNCQLLGGEVEKYASGLPIDMLRKRLNLTSLGATSALTGKENVAENAQERSSPAISIPISSETTKKMDQKAPINDKKDATVIGRIPSSSNTTFSLLDDDDFEDNTNDDPTTRNQVSFMESQNLTIEEEDSFDAPAPSELQRLREYQNARRIEQQLSTSSTCLRQQKEQTPPLQSDFSMTDELPPTPSPRRHYDEPVINRLPLQTKTLFSAPPIKRPRPSMLTTIKQEPDDVEVINLEDEDDDWKPAPKTLQGALEQYDRNESGEIERGKETPKHSGKIHENRWGTPSPNVRLSVSEPPILTAFKELKIVYIADALKQMRYTVGSLKRNVQGVIERVVEPLTIVDRLWTQTVAIRDESTSPDGINCIIAGKVLEQLIGMAPDEAAEIRRSSSVQRRSEGKARLVALQHAMERLDLIFEIEFFSRREVTPVICDLQTLAQRLNML